jgi:hypothetical protein
MTIISSGQRGQAITLIVLLYITINAFERLERSLVKVARLFLEYSQATGVLIRRDG